MLFDLYTFRSRQIHNRISVLSDQEKATTSSRVDGELFAFSENGEKLDGVDGGRE